MFVVRVQFGRQVGTVQAKCTVRGQAIPTSVETTASNAIIRKRWASDISLKDFTFLDLEDWCESVGEARSRALHLWRWLYSDHESYGFIRSLQQAKGRQNGFGKHFIQLAEGLGVTCEGGLHLQSMHSALDGTTKLLFATDRLGDPFVETVVIPIVRDQGGKERVTVCVSCQLGCAMGCTFCHTGKMGLVRQLTTAQIIEQLVEVKRYLASSGRAAAATNIVFMGMGEPFHNFEAVCRAIEIATHPLGLHFSKRKVTVSTVGLVPEIEKFCNSGVPAQLAVSLHAPSDDLRSTIVPVNRRFHLKLLMDCLRKHFPRGGQKGNHGEHVLFEYVMLRGVNDHLRHAQELVHLVKGVECKVNLIVFNVHVGTRFEPSDPLDVASFRSHIIKNGLVCTVRDSRGSDEMAACGQLGSVSPTRARNRDSQDFRLCRP